MASAVDDDDHVVVNVIHMNLMNIKLTIYEIILSIQSMCYNVLRNIVFLRFHSWNVSQLSIQ